MPEKTVVIHQPDFLSYLGFFHRLLKADLYVALDHVQFVSGTSRSWTSRDKIKTVRGERWLTVAVKKCPLGTPINEVLLSDSDWRRDNLNLITENYRCAPCFDEIMPHVDELYQCRCDRLVDFNMASIRMLMKLLGIDVPIVLSSTLQPRGRSNELLVDILKKVQADVYLSGVGAKAYFDPTPYESAGIRVAWQTFTHPEYPQCHGPFIPFLSTIDVLFNCGIAKSRTILGGC